MTVVLGLGLACGGAVAGAAPPDGHGPDPAAVDALGEVPGPSGGAHGRPLPGARIAATAADVAASLPESWCGERRATDDTTSEVANGDRRIHAVYALASDAVDRLSAIGGRLQTDAFQASALLEQLYGRALRFDMGTSCGPQYLDITTLRLEQASGTLAQAASGGTLLAELRAPLRAAGFDVAGESDRLSLARPRRLNLLVWLEGPAVPGLCGQATLYPDLADSPDNINAFGGKIAVVFRDGQFFCGSNTVRHELGHALGALLPGAPHAFDGAHCDDAYEDTMCYPQAPRREGGAFQARFFDFGNDDYWALPGRTLGHWTVDRSPFVCPDVSCNVPGGTGAAGGPDADGDGVPDVLDLCSGSDDVQALDLTGSPGCEDAPDAAPQGRASAAAARRRVVVRLRGRGRYRVVVRCAGRPARRWRGRGPRRLVLRVRCAGRPHARVRRIPR